ncbi:tRNA (N(6)-L-threonylcarbamoyladenosine(37)-C(2))-methylthiotransferase MtaB [Campylobacter sp. MIT 21-1685]|uniref:tRNA (N(6)-L-threonylcarbamoyladenosine(37)-C(2))- methylthiotransferase MtaB n=1 Tax=unclassified Campylobacter TaxID=2593542 RepID=UPI00224B1220|nr:MULTISPECIES: tRNA (N(6)-L-threonylcarbamoyladenosine(37)-C(2))-methylthiotransferase MtaB [unclassified Campylobacter]MCX2682938.1 tRNA (N(6)-L-threonylcarbamoyladenosine(37)-C(2))-methylthiotransferase MtaB [Campylobacter sp. MIT 21-1684]MCX2751220.1 tRNA (N(6)-L-threonylcarbamoyladenosine(37)-C(2))-methylthiotransferase MtaB [Campylobacter sp. MIT 21-1682]MCX2807419.1 tRNA (N(6)-L-threonylcarbamoyladenosine(37)-C(2))-methylthiotransferase MtaB [Campylobacter sp. MIT 21-1685]
MKQKVFFKTFGCRTNIYDTELLKNYIQEYEIVNHENNAQVIIINSCTVTNGADSGLQNYINAMQRRGVKILLTGCAAASKGKELLEKKQIFGVFGASEKEKINEFVSSKTNFYELGNLNFIDKNIVCNYENHTKAFVKIQEGCDFACSYCIIPSVRGKSRSVDEKTLLEQVKILSQNGYKEIVLTGTNIGSYGLKNGTTLGKLLQQMGQISGIKRIRLGSLEPAQLDESFFEILDETWLERHLHIALQHTSEKMLRIMKRRSHTENDLQLFDTLAKKGFALGTDFIVGHPGEDEEIWNEALKNFKEFQITHIHGFIFSPRKNTLSANLKEKINGKIAKARLNQLKEFVQDNNFKFRKKVKTPLEILIESEKGGFFEGYDQFFNKIKISSKVNLLKQWLILKEYEIFSQGNQAHFQG